MVMFMPILHKHQTGKKTYLQLKGIWVRTQNAQVVFLDLLSDSVGSCGPSCLIQWLGLWNLVPQRENPITQQSFVDRISFNYPSSILEPPLPYNCCPALMASRILWELLQRGVPVSYCPFSPRFSLKWSGMGPGHWWFSKCCPGDSTVWSAWEAPTSYCSPPPAPCPAPSWPHSPHHLPSMGLACGRENKYSHTYSWSFSPEEHPGLLGPLQMAEFCISKWTWSLHEGAWWVERVQCALESSSEYIGEEFIVLWLGFLICENGVLRPTLQAIVASESVSGTSLRDTQ